MKELFFTLCCSSLPDRSDDVSGTLQAQSRVQGQLSLSEAPRPRRHRVLRPAQESRHQGHWRARNAHQTGAEVDVGYIASFDIHGIASSSKFNVLWNVHFRPSGLTYCSQ